MAAARPHIYLLLLLPHLFPGGSAAQHRTFSDAKRCADPECSKLMCRGKAIADFTGPDCRFVNFKKDELIYVYHKLTGRSSKLWAGTIDGAFGYFPKDLVDIKQDYTKEEELVLPTDETDFVCFEDGADKFVSYDVDELLSKAKITVAKQTSPEASPPSASLAEGPSASESEVKLEKPSLKLREPPGDSLQSESKEPAKEAPPSQAGEEPSPSQTKEPPEKPPSTDSSKPLEEPSILESKVDHPGSQFIIPQDKPSDSGPTSEDLHLSSPETQTAHSQPEVDGPLGVSGPGIQPGEVFASESDKHTEEPLGSDSRVKQENPHNTGAQPLVPESDKPPVEVPTSTSQEQVKSLEKVSESDHRTEEHTISKEPLSTTNDVHATIVNSKSKDSQEESVTLKATEENAKSESQVPDSEQAKNVSISQGEDKKFNENVESFTLVDKDRIVTLKTEAGLTGDAVVTEDEETRRVTYEGEYQNEDLEPDKTQEDEGVEELEDTPLLSYEEFDVKSSDQTNFENDSASSTASEVKTSPAKEEGKVSVDMGHATAIQQDKSILTTLGDTFFAIVSGGEHTRDVSDLDGTDSEEEDDDEPIEELEEDENLYLLGMEKSNSHGNEHLEPPFDEDTVVPKEEGLQVESLETEQKINITANNLPEKTVNMSSADGTLLSNSSPDTEPAQVNPDVQEPTEITSELKNDSEKPPEKIQMPPNNTPVEGSEMKKSGEENKVNADYSDKPMSEAMQENKDVALEDAREGLLGQESLKQEDSGNEDPPKLSEGSNLEKPNRDQDPAEEVTPDKSPSLSSEVPEDDKSTGDSLTPEHQGDVENSHVKSSDPVVEETQPPEAGSNEEKGKLEDKKPVDEPKFEKLPIVEDDLVQVDSTVETSETNRETEHKRLELSKHNRKQESKDTNSIDSLKEGSMEPTSSNQNLEGTPSDVESPPISVDEEKDNENVDGFLEDENASARQAKEMLSKAEQETKMDAEESAKSKPNQEVNNSDLENKDTNPQENEESLILKKDGKTPTMEEEIVKESQESAVVTEGLTLKNNNSDSSDTKIEIKDEEGKTEAERKAETAKVDVQEGISDQTDDKIADLEDREPIDEDLVVDSINPNNDIVEEASYIENIRALSIMREFLDEERIAQFTKYLGPDNLMRLEAMFQDMEAEMKLARRDNHHLDHIDKTLYQIFEASESNMFDFVDSVLESREVNHEEMVTEKEMFDEESALLDDIQEISYLLRHKYSTMSDSSLLVPGDVKEEDDDKSSTDEVDPEGDKSEPKPVIKKEEPPATQPPEEEMLEQPSEEEIVEQPPEEEIVEQPPEEELVEQPPEEELVEQPPEEEIVEQPPEEEIVEQPPEEEIVEQPPEEEIVEQPSEEEIVEQRPEEEIVEQLPETEDMTFEKEEAEVVLPTQDSLDHLPNEPDEALSQTAEDAGIDTALEVDGGEESRESDSWHTSILQMISSMGSALMAAKKSLVPVASLVQMDEMEAEDPGSSSSLGAEPAFLGPLPTLYSLLMARLLQLMSALPEDLRPGPDFYGVQWEAVIITVLVGLISVLIFFWRTCLSVKSRVYQVSEKQLAEKIGALMKEKSSALEKISELENKIKEAKESESTTHEKSTHLQEEASSLKGIIKELKNNNKQLDSKMKNLQQELNSQKSQNKRKQEMVLSNCLMQLKQLEEDSLAGEDGSWQPAAGDGDMENGELPDKRKEKMKLQIKQMMDVSRVKTTLSIIKEEKELYQRKLTDEISARHQLEEQIEDLQHDGSSLLRRDVVLDNECKTLRQKVEILTELYQQKEMALQKKLTQEEYERQEKEQKLSVADEKAILAVEEVKIYKQRIQEMEEELQKTERSFKNQIATHEKKAHENWLVARTAERTLAEEKRECANLRQKLIEVNQRVVSLQRPSIVKPTPGRPEHQAPPRRAALSRDGSFAPSPVSGGAPSPPIMMDVSVRSASANLSRSEDLKANAGEVPSGSRRPPHDVSGRTSAPVDLGHSASAMNSGPRTSSPAVDGLVMPLAKGSPSFPGTPVMNSPAGAPMMSQPPGRMIGSTPPRGHFGARSLPPTQMHGPPPVPRDFPPRPLIPPGGFPADPRGLFRGPLPPREYPPGPGPMHAPRDYPMPPPGLPPPGPREFPPGPHHPGSRDFPPGPHHPGSRDFPPGPHHPGSRDFPPGPHHPGSRDFPPGPHHPGSRDFPPSPHLPGSRDFLPGPPPPGARDFPPGPRDFPPGLPPLGAQEFPPGMRDFPPGSLHPGARDLPPGLPPPGARDFPPVLPPMASREFIPGLPPPGARNFLPGPPLASREFLPGPPLPGARDGPPMGARDFIPGPHPGVPAGPSLANQRAVPPGHSLSSQTDNGQSHAPSKP
ncbi:transport and Golgi organization protein 1 homolog [Mantella aurantiaca]